MKIERESLNFKRLLSRNRAHAARGLQDSEAGPGATPAQHFGVHRACGNDGMHTHSGLRSAAGGERLRHEPRQGLHREHPRRMVNLPDMVESSNSKQRRRATEGAEITGARRQCWVAPVVGEVGHASGGCSDHASGSCSEVIGEVGHTSKSCSEVVREVGHASESCSDVVGCSGTDGR
jgi:hypothetical protein